MNTSAYPVFRIHPLLLNLSLLLGFAVAGFLTLLVSAQFQALFWPVSVTLQTLAVGIFAYGAAQSQTATTLKQRLGVVGLALAAVVPYAITARYAGVPVSASNPAFSWGFLAGFGLMASVIAFGWTYRQPGNTRHNLKLASIVGLLGIVAVYLPGLPIMHQAIVAISPEQTWQATLYTYGLLYLPGDLLKTGVAACLAVLAASRKS